MGRCSRLVELRISLCVRCDHEARLLQPHTRRRPLVHRPAGALLHPGSFDIASVVAPRFCISIDPRLLRRGNDGTRARAASSFGRSHRLRRLGAASCAASRPGFVS